MERTSETQPDASGPTIVVVDNRDSFTFNLVQVLQDLGASVEVARSTAVSAPEVLEREPDGILIGPGPGRPDGAGCSEALLRTAPHELPILGVCLGHQAIATSLGGTLVRANELVHGATRPLRHDGSGVFEGLENPFAMARYNSLAVCEKTLPKALEVVARTEDGEIAGLRHRDRPTFGVQGHPESILCVGGADTTGGRRLFANFLAICRQGKPRTAR